MSVTGKIVKMATAIFSISISSCAQLNSESPTKENIVASAIIKNANSFGVESETVYFSFYDLGLSPGDAREEFLHIFSKGELLPSQIIDKDADGKKDGLLVTLDFTAAEEKSLVVVNDKSIKRPSFGKKTQAEISHKDGGQWQGKTYVGGVFKNVNGVVLPPQHTDHSYFLRYEGPGIESDKVAYRIVLDERNGFDIFGKKNNAMALQNIGLDGFESYHHDAAWGQDILKIGSSLGTGGFGFWNGKSVELLAKVDSREAVIANNGDLFSSFKINYKGWSVDQQKRDVAAHFSMSAESRLVHVDIKTNKGLPNLAIGLVKHPGTTLIEGNTNVTGSAWTYVASWGKQSLSGENDHLGMAVIFKRGDRILQTQDNNNYVSVLNDSAGDIEYYFLAAWDKELNGIKTADQFKNYLDREVERLTKLPRIRFESTLSANAKTGAITAAEAANWSKRLADSELERKTFSYHYGGWDVYRKRPARFEYDTAGLQIQALQQLNEVIPDTRYTEAAEKITGSFIDPQGTVQTHKPELFSIDYINAMRVIILLEQRTGNKKYKEAAEYMRNRMRIHPRTSEGAFWHRIIYPDQLWLDGVYMGMPFLAQYAAAYEKGKQQHESFEEAVHEFVLAKKYLLNKESGLYFHAWDESRKAEWANKQNGLASQYWSRGMGWYAMALVDMLDYIPVSEKELRNVLISDAQQFAADIIRYQDPATGTWWQITDKPDGIANYRESSASAMFTYFLAKSIHNGYLSTDYSNAALKAYSGLINEFITVHADGKISMNDQCYEAGLGFGRDGSYNYYMTERIVSNDPKGNGPFIMAGVAISKMLTKYPEKDMLVSKVNRPFLK